MPLAVDADHAVGAHDRRRIVELVAARLEEADDDLDAMLRAARRDLAHLVAFGGNGGAERAGAVIEHVARQMAFGKDEQPGTRGGGLAHMAVHGVQIGAHVAELGRNLRDGDGNDGIGQFCLQGLVSWEWEGRLSFPCGRRA